MPEDTPGSISSSAQRNAPLAMSGEEFRKVGYELVDQIASFLDNLGEGPVTPGGSPSEIRALIKAEASMPQEGQDPAELMRKTARMLHKDSLHNGHPRFMAYITASAAPIGMLGDMLAASVNPNVGAWILSPLASEIEAQTVRWIAELLDYPVDSGGLLVSGGNMANMVCFWAARAAAGGPGIRETGCSEDGRALVAYASAETHTWIQKAADLSGLGTDIIRWIPTNQNLQMDLDLLRSAMDEDIAAGRRPMMVVGTGGSVSTGAVDGLREIAAICAERDTWFHVDGAYGALAAMLPDAPEELHHLKLADSVAMDPHKWLYAPLEAGCALVKNVEHLRNAFSYHPAYYHFGIEATNFVDLGPQNSRGFRALKVWLALQQAGRSGYQTMLADDIRLTRLLHETAAAHPDIDTFTCDLSISTFRYVPAALRSKLGEPDTEERLNRINKEIQARMEAEGDGFVSNAVLDGKYVLRSCIVNFRTQEVDAKAIPYIVARAGEVVFSEERTATG